MTFNGVMTLIFRYFTEFVYDMSLYNNYKAYFDFRIYFG